MLLLGSLSISPVPCLRLCIPLWLCFVALRFHSLFKRHVLKCKFKESEGGPPPPRTHYYVHTSCWHWMCDYRVRIWWLIYSLITQSSLSEEMLEVNNVCPYKWLILEFSKVRWSWNKCQKGGERKGKLKKPSVAKRTCSMLILMFLSKLKLLWPVHSLCSWFETCGRTRIVTRQKWNCHRSCLLLRLFKTFSQTRIALAFFLHLVRTRNVLIFLL